MSRLYPCVYCTEDGYCEKYSDDEVTSWCVQSPCKDEKPSNADHIRSMTDEELAAWLCDVAGWLPAFEGRVHPILEWLKEASDGEG